jgi:hypothetical protein
MKLVQPIKKCLCQTKVKSMLVIFLSAIQNVLKQDNASPLFLFKPALEYAIKNAQDNWERLKLNGIHQFLISVDDAISWL